VVKSVEQEKRDRMVEAAFIGWQGYIIQPRSKQPMNFQRWLSSVGLGQKPKPPSMEDRRRAIQKARENAQRVAEAFG
jgi:hypothetical protein